MSAATDAFVKDNRHRLLEELKQFLRIPSISTLAENRADVERAANFVADALRTAGMENVELIQTDKHPLVYADWLHAPGKPTVLCYGHYDVQPADPLVCVCPRASFAPIRDPSVLPDHYPRKHRSQRRRCRRSPRDHVFQRPVWRRHEPEQPLGECH
jgi:hypothetical protein